MPHQTYFEKVESLKVLIERKRANTAPAIARKLNVSQRTVLLMLDHVAKSGTPIVYCRSAKMYLICNN